MKEVKRTFTLRTSDGFVESFGPGLLDRLAVEADRDRAVGVVDLDDVALIVGVLDVGILRGVLDDNILARRQRIGFGLDQADVGAQPRH